MVGSSFRISCKPGHTYVLFRVSCGLTTLRFEMIAPESWSFEGWRFPSIECCALISCVISTLSRISSLVPKHSNLQEAKIRKQLGNGQQCNDCFITISKDEQEISNGTLGLRFMQNAQRAKTTQRSRASTCGGSWRRQMGDQWFRESYLCQWGAGKLVNLEMNNVNFKLYLFSRFTDVHERRIYPFFIHLGMKTVLKTLSLQGSRTSGEGSLIGMKNIRSISQVI